MLKISESQLQALSQAATNDFVNRLVAHLRRVFPDRCAELGEPVVREWIAAGMAKARSYTLDTELLICKYIDMMMVLGADFDTRPPWAAVFRQVKSPRVFWAAFDEAYEDYLNESHG